MKQRLLLFGGAGKLGSVIKRIFSEEFEIIAPRSSECDISSFDDVHRKFDAVRPDIVINAAAMVGARECDKDKEGAWKVNVEGAINVARACREYSSRLIFISSAAIFDGDVGEYRETDTPSPTYYYAVTKVVAEQACMMIENVAIVRIDFFDENFCKYKTVYEDHYTSKISSLEAARKIKLVAVSDYTGIINVGGPKDTLLNILKPVFNDIQGIKIKESSIPDFPRDISLDLSVWNEKFTSH